MAENKGEGPRTIGDLMKAIVELSGKDDSVLPIVKGCMWFGMYDASGRLGPPVTLHVDEKSPFNPRMHVVGLFQNDSEVRVYSVPISNKVDKGETALPTRHTLNKIAPTFVFEVMPLETFQMEYATELQALAENTATLEDFEDEDEPEPEPGPGDEEEEEEEVEQGEETGAPDA